MIVMSANNPHSFNNSNSNERKRQSMVSDDDAAQALIASALQKSEKRSKPPSLAAASHNNKRPRRSEHGRYRDDDDDRGYYGPADNTNNNRKGYKPTNDTKKDNNTDPPEEEEEEKKKADFGLSGALTQQASTTGGMGGNLYKGIQLKFQEPPEARTPNTLWRLHVFKRDEQVQVLHVARQSAYLIGRQREICDIVLDHTSISSQHAVLQYRALPNKNNKLSCVPYLMDLQSTNGTFVNGIRLEAARYYQLQRQDVIRFGASSRDYVLLAAPSLKAK